MTVNVLFARDNFWLTQKVMADLFGVKIPAVNKHFKNIFESGELVPSATVSKMETVQTEGEREVVRDVEYYNLDAVIAVGYRVNSLKATANVDGGADGGHVSLLPMLKLKIKSLHPKSVKSLRCSGVRNFLFYWRRQC